MLGIKPGLVLDLLTSLVSLTVNLLQIDTYQCQETEMLQRRRQYPISPVLGLDAWPLHVVV